MTHKLRDRLFALGIKMFFFFLTSAKVLANIKKTPLLTIRFKIRYLMHYCEITNFVSVALQVLLRIYRRFF